MTKKRSLLHGTAIIFCFFLLLCTLIFPKEASESISRSLSLAILRVVPSLFVFSVLASLFARLGLFYRVGKLGRHIGLSPAQTAVALCGMLCGFPTSAVCANALWQVGAADKSEMRAILPFCSNASMAFVVGAVGENMLGSKLAGYILFSLQVLVSIIFIMLFCRSKTPCAPLPSNMPRESFSHALVDSISSSGITMLSICAFIAFFGAVADMLCLALEAMPPFLRALLCSFLEISRGCAEFSGATGLSPLMKYTGIGFSLGFSGISVACQISACALDISPPLMPYLAKKMVFGLTMAAICGVFRFL